MFPSAAIYGKERRAAPHERGGETRVTLNREDEHLNRLLQEWTPGTLAPDELRSGVWRRIEATPETGLRLWMQRIGAVLDRPALASAVVGMALVAGVGIGAQLSSAAQMQEYVRSLSPYEHRR
jgi:hypothetical protein